jgi:hypothetical protein
LKMFFLENHWARIVQIYMKASWHSVDSFLYKLWSPGVGGEHDRGSNFYMCILEKIFCIETSGQYSISIKLGTNHFCMKGTQVYSNEGPNSLQRVGG